MRQIKLMQEECLAVFRSYNQAVLLYNILCKAGHEAKIVSTPTLITNSCSKSIVFKLKYIEYVKEEIKKKKLKCYGIYRRKLKNKMLTYEKIK